MHGYCQNANGIISLIITLRWCFTTTIWRRVLFRIPLPKPLTARQTGCSFCSVGGRKSFIYIWDFILWTWRIPGVCCSLLKLHSALSELQKVVFQCETCTLRNKPAGGWLPWWNQAWKLSAWTERHLSLPWSVLTSLLHPFWVVIFKEKIRMQYMGMPSKLEKQPSFLPFHKGWRLLEDQTDQSLNLPYVLSVIL